MFSFNFAISMCRTLTTQDAVHAFDASILSFRMCFIKRVCAYP